MRYEVRFGDKVMARFGDMKDALQFVGTALHREISAQIEVVDAEMGIAYDKAGVRDWCHRSGYGVESPADTGK